MVFLRNPEYGCDLHSIDFAAFARACGGTGFTIEEPTQCGEILERALAQEGTGRCRSGSGSFRLTSPGENHPTAGNQVRAILGPGRAQSRSHRVDCVRELI
jgi:hypothetical protein